MKKLLVVGGSEKQLPIIKRAKEMGIYVLCIDGNPNSVGYQYADTYKTIDINDYDACLKYAKDNNIDGVATLSATATLPTVNYIAEKMNLIGNPFSVSEKLKSKYEIKKILRENDLNVYGNFFEIHSINDIGQIKDKIQYPIVVKPSDGSASKGVKIINSEDTLYEDVKYSLECSRISSVYIEGYISGNEYSAESFVSNGNVVVLGIVKTTMIMEEDGLLNYGHCVPSGLDKDVEKIIKDEVIKAIKALNIQNGSVNMDIILSNDNVPYIIDLGPRMGLNLIASHIIPYSTGFNVIDNTIKIALNEKINMNISDNKPIATRLLIMKPGLLKEIKSFDLLLENNSNILEIVLKVKPGDIIKKYVNKSDTCGWVICRGKDVEEANSNAYRAKKELEKYFVIEEI